MPTDRFLLIGHSFVRKVRDAIDSEEPQYADYHEDFGLRQGRVRIVGDFGKDMPLISYIGQVDRWVQANPKVLKATDVTLIDCASNDLLHHYYCDSENLAKMVYHVAKRCLKLGSKRVVIRQVIWRQGVAALPRWETNFRPEVRRRAVETYNTSVINYNDFLMTMVRKGTSRITVQKPQGLKLRGYLLLRDGVHLTDEGLRKYYLAIRNEFIRQAFKARR